MLPEAGVSSAVPGLPASQLFTTLLHALPPYSRAAGNIADQGKRMHDGHSVETSPPSLMLRNPSSQAHKYSTTEGAAHAGGGWKTKVPDTQPDLDADQLPAATIPEQPAATVLQQPAATVLQPSSQPVGSQQQAAVRDYCLHRGQVSLTDVMASFASVDVDALKRCAAGRKMLGFWDWLISCRVGGQTEAC